MCFRSSRTNNISGILHGSPWCNKLSPACLNFDRNNTHLWISGSLESLSGGTFWLADEANSRSTPCARSDHSSSCRLLCLRLGSYWPDHPSDMCQSPDCRLGRTQPVPVLLHLHPNEARSHCQHLGWSNSRRDSTCDGLYRHNQLHRFVPLSECQLCVSLLTVFFPFRLTLNSAWFSSLLVAISPLQRPVVEHATRVRSRWLPHDVSHRPEAVPEYGSSAFSVSARLYHCHVRHRHDPLVIRRGHSALLAVPRLPFVSLPHWTLLTDISQALSLLFNLFTRSHVPHGHFQE